MNRIDRGPEHGSEAGPTLAIYPDLKGRRVLVTGGASGIGAAIVEAFVRQGSEVLFVDIAKDDGLSLKARLAGSGPAVRFLSCDLRDVRAIEALFARIADEFGPVEILINNAGNDDRHEVGEVTPEYWDDRIAVNLRHLFFCAQSVVPAMKAMGRGVILNLGSVSWHLALPNLTVYQAAKAGIEGMTRGLARELGAYGIRVACIVPGAVRTPRQMKLWLTPEEEARILGQQCLKARIEPADVAAMALFLASDSARMCTGHEYFVDAGWR